MRRQFGCLANHGNKVEVMFLNNIKKQASSFLQEKYNTVRLALTDVTQPQLLAEEATNDSPYGPDAKTMTKIAEASFEVDSYWRTVQVLHKRRSYKCLVLLEFLLTHGPQDFSNEFQCQAPIIQELATFQYIDENGIDWGLNMKAKSESILELLSGGDRLKHARLKALKITKEIRGFGNSSPTVSSPSSSCGTPNSSSSFGSYSSSSTLCDINDFNNVEKVSSPTTKGSSDRYFQAGSLDEEEDKHIWECYPIEEEGSLLDLNDQELGFQEKDGFIGGICSKFGGNNPILGYGSNNKNKKLLFGNNISGFDKQEKRKKFSLRF